MKIENYETYKSDITADTFTFPHNPNQINRGNEKFIDRKNFAYSFTRVGVSDDLKTVKPLDFTGHFEGTNANQNIRELSRHFNDNKIKKLFVTDDRFRICICTNFNAPLVGTRPTFRDYTMNLISPIARVFDSTEKSGSETGTAVNNGNQSAPILRITGEVTSGSEAIIQTTAGDGIKFTPDTTGTAEITFVNYEEIGGRNKFTSYMYCEIDGNRQNIVVSNVSMTPYMRIEPNDSLNDTFSGGTIQNISNLQFYFYDSYSSE